jgi:ankyrin repeat protein
MAQRQKEKEKGRFRKRAMRLLELGKKSAKRMLMLPNRRKQLDNAFLEAARVGDNADIERLLKKGANIEAKDEDGWTPLIYAARNGHTPTCALLLEKGADIKAKNDYGWTALMCAAANGYTPTCALLLEKGADLNAKAEKGDYKGKTASSIAEKRGKKGTAAFLKSMKLLSGQINKNGMQDFLRGFRECVGTR